MNRIAFTMLTAAVLGGVLLSCGKKSASDQTLTTDIQAKLYADAATKPANVSVTVRDGIATLSGAVPSSDIELAAMKIANGTPGVKSVNDRMKVDPSMAGNQLPDAGNSQPQNPAPAPDSMQPPPPGPSAAPPPAEPVTVTIPAGDHVSVRMIDSIDSAHNTSGQVFRASLYAPVVSHGRVVIPKGTPVSVLLAASKDAGRIKGRSGLEVRLSAIDYHGREYRVDSSIYEEQGKARGKQTAVRTGIGAAAGAVIGAIAGGGKGAAIGSAAGGGAGFGVNLFTHGQQVKIPSETILTFRLSAPLTLER